MKFVVKCAFNKAAVNITGRQTLILTTACRRRRHFSQISSSLYIQQTHQVRLNSFFDNTLTHTCVKMVMFVYAHGLRHYFDMDEMADSFKIVVWSPKGLNHVGDLGKG